MKKVCYTKRERAFFTIFLIIIVSIPILFFFGVHVLVPSMLFGESKINKIAMDLAGNKTNETQIVLDIMGWENENVYNTWSNNGIDINDIILPNLRFPFLTSLCKFSGDPNWIITTKCGSCGEYSSLFSALSNEITAQGKANISSRVISTYSLNHAWNEVEINGVWTHLDLGAPVFNDSKYYERVWNSYLEYVYYLDSDNNIQAITNRYNENVTKIDILVLSDNLPVKGANVLIKFSNGYGFVNRTDSEGRCIVDKIGVGEYLVKAEIEYVIKEIGIKHAEVNANNNETIIINLDSYDFENFINISILILLIIIVILVAHYFRYQYKSKRTNFIHL